jgi:hypothetical protein
MKAHPDPASSGIRAAATPAASADDMACGSSPESLRFVTGTRLSPALFSARSPLCLSLEQAARCRGLTIQAHADNSTALPVLYNQALDVAADDDVLVFAHDDLWVQDWMIAWRLHEALARFDVVGVAGTTRRLPRQDRWWWNDATRGFDHPHLSGQVCHGGRASAHLKVYGPTPAEVRLLDGVLLAARARTLRRAGVRFDPRFRFDFYDLDFCRQCERAGLRMGTWPIAVTHESVGPGVGKAPWIEARRAYFAKWGD